jgi:hypothetical protein
MYEYKKTNNNYTKHRISANDYNKVQKNTKKKNTKKKKKKKKKNKQKESTKTSCTFTPATKSENENQRDQCSHPSLLL